MTPHLTVCYLTNRLEPKIEWFFDSLNREMAKGLEYPVRLVVVDFFWDKRPDLFGAPNIKHVSPKPCVWQGKHRLTKEDWFAASNARNTALCYAPDGWIAYVDDLSVLRPGWMNSIREAMAGNYIICGAYQKVKDLVVENGEVKTFTHHEGGMDSRGVNQDVTPCGGNWLYGCSVAGPVEAFLSVNGWPEDLCDGLGFEDCCMGIVLKNAGYELRYDRRMMTYESEEHHHNGGVAFRRDDWHFQDGKPVRGGNGRDDKSHAALNIAARSNYFPNCFPDGTIRQLRQRILAGEPFQIQNNPRHEWFSAIPLSEL